MRKIGALYEGRGLTLQTRNGSSAPLFADNCNIQDPHGYLADEGLAASVNVALALGQPLLITGEPGTGKTQLGHSIAYELGLRLFVFNTKTTSTYQDLIYKYDALRHYQAVQLGNSETDPRNYIIYGPIGEAIRCAMDRQSPFCPPEYRNTPCERSVVLIDEIDKAPRDLPNDVLNEIDRMSFEVPECHLKFGADGAFRPILVFTSNLEKDLPAAFRRRCVFYHITFPNDQELEAIIKRRLGIDNNNVIQNALKHFRSIRDLDLEKLPATAELISWMEVLNALKLEDQDFSNLSPEQSAALVASLSVLAKTADDLRRVKEHFAEGHAGKGN